jgi:HemY protein
MWRALGFLALLAVAAYAAVWLADQPGLVTLSWNGYEATTSLAVVVVGIALVALALALVWSLVTGLIALPVRLRVSSRARRRAKGYAAVSRGMVAVGSGDPTAARRLAGEAERLLGREPLALLLKAQAAQISGDRIGAEAAFQRMTDEPETRVLGLRGLYVEARRRNDAVAARAYAAEAARLAPSVAWANEATLEAQCGEGDWRGALETVERRATLGSLEKGAARRQRAVLLTAEALGREAGEPERAAELAAEAARLAPDLVPAAALAGRLLARRGELKRAAKVVEAAWRKAPHPDLAEAYVGLRTGDSTRDRMQRAEVLAKLSGWDTEGRLAVARAAFEAREFEAARKALVPLLTGRPSLRVCLLMARIEEAEHGRAAGGAREWLARAARAPRDPMWIADGVASDHWEPISPVTGRLDAFVWQTPPDILAGPAEERPEDEPAAAELPPMRPAVPPPAAEPAPPLSPTAATPPPRPRPPEARPAAPVVFPVAHAPDDPGSSQDPDSEAERRRRFG